MSQGRYANEHERRSPIRFETRQRREKKVIGRLPSARPFSEGSVPSPVMYTCHAPTRFPSHFKLGNLVGAWHAECRDGRMSVPCPCIASKAVELPFNAILKSHVATVLAYCSRTSVFYKNAKPSSLLDCVRMLPWTTALCFGGPAADRPRSRDGKKY